MSGGAFHRLKATRYEPAAQRDNAAISYGHKNREERAAANKRLVAACNATFARFERQHGLRKGEGRILLLDIGVRL